MRFALLSALLVPFLAGPAVFDAGPVAWKRKGGARPEEA